MMSEMEITNLIKTISDNPAAIHHLFPILTDIQDVMLNDRIPGKFVECVIAGDWVRAILIADHHNKEILTGIPPKEQRGIIWQNIPPMKDNLFAIMVDKVRKTKEHRNKVITDLLEDE